MPPKGTPRKRQHPVPPPPEKPKPVKRKPGKPPSIQTPVGAIFPGAQGGPLDPKSPKQIATERTRVQRILSRQRLLKSAGYKNIVVDGIWGPRSQKAWQDYKTNRPIPLRSVGSVQREESSIIRRETTRVQRIQKQAAEAKLAAVEKEKRKDARVAVQEKRAAARRVVQMQIRNQRKAVQARGRQLMADPTLARKLSLRQITEVFSDPGFELDTQNRVHITVIQEHLRSRGRPVEITGEYNRQTHDALEAALNEEQENERRAQTRRLVHEFYEPGVVRAGDTPQWWPLDGPVPQPGKLLEILQEGSFTSSLIFNALIKESSRPNARFERWRTAELTKLAARFQPHAGATALSRLFGPEAVSDWQLYNEILLSNPWAQDPEGMENKAARAEREKHAGELSAHLKSIMTAKSVGEFQRKQTAFLADEDRKWRAKQQEIAGTSSKWWHGPVKYVMAPGEFMRTALVHDVYLAMDVMHGDFSGLMFDQSEENALRWEAAAEAREGFSKSHPYWNFAFEALADPLNFAHPFRTASWAMRGTRYGSKYGGYTLKPIYLGPVGSRVSVGQRALVYERGTWGGVLRGHAAAQMSKHPVGIATLDFGRRVTQLKEDVVKGVTQNLSVAARNSFGKVYSGAKTTRGKLKPEAQKRVDDARERRKAAILEVARLDKNTGAVLSTLRDARAALYIHADRHGELSNVGASLLARYNEEARVQVIQRLISSSAHNIRDHGTRESWSVEQIERAMADEARLITEAAGVFVAGAPDTGVATTITLADGTVKTVQVASHVSKVVQGMGREFEESVLPALQDLLDEFAEASGYSLWDESLLWVGRQGTYADELRTLTREAFDPDRTVSVRNPLYGKPHSYDEYKEAAEGEIRRGSYRAYAYNARGIEGNTLPKGWNLDDRLEEIRNEVEGAWEKRADGKWYDDREFIQAPDIYARGQMETYFIREGGTHTLLPFESYAALGERPMFSGGSAFDQFIGQTSWDLGGASRRMPARLRGAPQVRRFTHFTGDEAVDKARRDALDELAAAMRESQEALAEGWDSMLSGELRGELALVQAFGEAQSWYMKTLYFGLKGALNTWIFASLALRPAWAVRNTVDNFSKLWIAGVRDPRAYFIGGARPGQLIRSVFDSGVNEMLATARFIDGLMNTNVAAHVERLTETFWQHSAETLSKIFSAHSIDIPEHLLDDMRLDPYMKGREIRRPFVEGEPATGLRAVFEHSGKGFVRNWQEGAPVAALKDIRWSNFRQGMFDIMGAHPENYAKRVLYRDTFDKTVKARMAQGANRIDAEREAHVAAMNKIEETLFDYSKITVMEENLRYFFPFIQFWRKNSTLWVQNFARKPWLSLSLLKFEEARDTAHADEPAWMRRYFDFSEITDALAVIPGLEPLIEHLGAEDAQYDPLNFTSFGMLYRAFKGENPTLPPDEAGNSMVDGFLEFLEQYTGGLGPNPLIIKPLENAGIARYQAWRSVFPQTAVAEALTRKFWGDVPAGYVRDWESLWGLLGQTPSDAIGDRFNYFVQMEMAGQAERGESMNREHAEQKIRDLFLVQNMWGYFAGIYWRRNNPSDYYLSKLSDSVATGRVKVSDLAPRDQKLWNLWDKRKMNRLTFDRFVQMYPLLQSFYQQSDYESSQRMLDEHPELIPHVSFLHKPYGTNFVKNAVVAMNTAEFYRVAEMANELELPFDVKEAATDLLSSPELKAYWAANDTPKDRRDKMIQGEMHSVMSSLTDAYFAIPETDYAAKDDFLAQHPELTRHWGKNNDPGDDYEALLGQANADLRETYFAIQREQGWNGANRFLKAYPWMFEGTKTEAKIDEEIGTWKATSDHARAYLAAKPDLDWFFNALMTKVGKDQAFKWLYNADTDRAKIIRDYFAKWGKKGGSTAHARDYLAAKSWLKVYFDLPEKERAAWLAGDSEGAKIVKQYFDKWASEKGHMQHARDYLDAKPLLDRYFAMPQSARGDWLDSGTQEAQVVLDYFKKYGKVHQKTRAFLKANADMAGGTPEQRRRLTFWQKYFALTPDQRPSFVLAEAENHGVFIYGAFGEQEQHDRQMMWSRRALSAGLSQRQAAFLYVKPLLDFFQTLPKEQRALFLKGNPELQDYFDRYVDNSPTGDKKLDKLVEAYFSLEENSLARSEYLRKHPEVQDYFDERSTPAERAMRAVLEVYFGIRDPNQRRAFLEEHPEIPTYFEQRRAERDAEREQLSAFDRADPRFSPYLEAAEADIYAAGDRMRRVLREQAFRKHRPKTIETRRDRREPVTL